MSAPGGGRWLTVGFAVSLLVHALLVAVLVTASAGAGEARTPRRSSSEQPDDPIRFGLDTPARATINWLGIEEPTPEHTAPVATDAEQAALALDAQGGPASPDATPAPPTPEAAAAESAPPAAPPPPTARVEPPEGPMPVLPEARPDPEPRPEEGEQADPEADPVLEAIQSPSPTPDARPSEPREPAPAPAAGSGPIEGAGTADAPGLPSERESDAIAKVETVDVHRWTTPAVGEGIEIRPVRPRWPTHFGLGRLTRPALVEITFHRPPEEDPAGGVVARVKLAQFAREEQPDGSVEIRGSGDPDVDSIVLNTIYQWTAAGARIERLGPDGTLVVRVRLFSVR